ncbi:LOW QUALITY PROTEIN: sodium- and chloride-dependent glycine transporter 1 [Drosophila mauritiana]|uniref:LOW QUALITY PROTEIN: sodium- and chloride-dependent glycine transporter 1 n=1 Tax=Drosophila mauritiana TaxID=7226 RepID=A0A6P8JUI9_DROMA|nr:LOW QUALITY PROTEIN: sodium- and chloride-dependent glycine transporter 1 [Drosophila mauritiana]
MIYETSYDSGHKPFSPDLKRGKWDKPTDYIFACFGLALKLDIFVASYWFFFDMGIFGMLPYLVYMVIYLVPIMVIHSFMGQFSSSGFISAFRLSPFFKGMGYVSVFLTIAMLIYYSIFAAVPLLFMINSFRPTLPWSCEGFKLWYNESDGRKTTCNMTISEDLTDISDNNTHFHRILFHVPSVLYFLNNFESVQGEYYTDLRQESELSWRFVSLFILVWAGSFDSQVLTHWTLFLSSATALSSLGWPNLWTFIYYTMLLMAALIVITTQIFTVLQSLFDEFEILRVRKQEVTFGLIGGIAVCSFYFCTNHGITFFAALGLDAIFSHSLLHLLLLLVVLWIYGRERFQRDIEFMLGQPFASWKIFILRFIAPIILIMCLVLGIFVCYMEHSYTSPIVLGISIVLVILPMMAIPGYGIYYIYRSTGSFCERFRRTCRPTDWYPVEMEHRQQYEEAVSNTDMTQQLTAVPN